MIKRPELVHKKKAGGSDFDHLSAVSLSYLLACLTTLYTLSVDQAFCDSLCMYRLVQALM